VKTESVSLYIEGEGEGEGTIWYMYDNEKDK